MPAKDRNTVQDGQRTALIVLGMHRSGTSAVTRVLSLCGVALPGNLVDPAGGKPNDGNRLAGFWESDTLRQLHDEMLASAGSAWDDAGGLSSEWFGSGAAAEFRSRLENVLEEEYGNASLFVVKDPRMCRLVPIWRTVLDRMHIRTGFVIVVRDPLEIAASLNRRDGIPQPKSMLIWLNHVLAAEFDTRSAPRVFVTYDGLLDDWKTVVGRVESVLSVGLQWGDGRIESEIEVFLDKGLRHQAEAAGSLSEREDVSDWVRTTYRWALDAATGGSPDSQELDQVRTELAKAEAAFGPLTRTLQVRIAEQNSQIQEVSSRQSLDGSVASRLEQTESRLSEIENRVETQFADLERHRVELAAAVEDARGKISDDLRYRLGSIQEQLLSVGRATKEQAAAQTRHIDQLIAGAESSRAETVDRVLSLQDQLSRFDGRIAELATRLQTVVDEVAGDVVKARADAEGLSRTIEQVRIAQADAAACVAEMAGGFSSFRRELNRLGEVEQELGRLSNAVQNQESLRGQVAESQRVAQELRERLHGSDEALDRLGTSLVSRLEDLERCIGLLAERGGGGAPEQRDQLHAVGSRLAKGSVFPHRDRGRRTLFSSWRLAKVLGLWALRGRFDKAWRCSRDARALRRSGLVDDEFYLSQYPDVARARIDPSFHYVAWGAAEARDPNHVFDTRYYVSHNGAKLKSGENPLLHYLRSGATEGVATSAFFDTAFYLETNPEAAESGCNPLLHFLNVGFWHGLQTSRRSCNVASQGNAAAVVSRAGTTGGQIGARTGINPSTIAANVGLSDDEVRLIAFYLPQFHPIPENDRWWGKGFTEWTNVTRAEPLFPWHRQPVLPTDMGYYDLRVSAVLQEQSSLARRYGVFGFCFYAYWFSGRRLLERPLELILENPGLDIRFCVCWANENWTRNWDGEDEKTLISQDHSLESDGRFIDDMIPFLLDPRYIRVDGNPLLVVYRPDYMIDPKSTARLWRRKCEEAGLPGLHLCAVGWKVDDPLAIGFDAIVEFPPHSLEQIEITDRFQPLDPGFTGHVYDYPAAVERVVDRSAEGFPVYRGVMPAWDNTPRRGLDARLFWGSNPDLYQAWLSRMVEETHARPPGTAKLVFINSWNEWAEGAMLEPSTAFGSEYLEATRAALEAGRSAKAPDDEFPGWQWRQGDLTGVTDDAMPVLVVSHDAARAGAQLTLLETLRGLLSVGSFEFFIILCDGGELEPEFLRVGHVLNLSGVRQDKSVVRRAAAALGERGYRGGFALAICNSIMTSHMAVACGAEGIPILSFVWELPTSIRAIFGEHRVAEIVDASHRVVVASDFARRELAREFSVDADALTPIHIGFLGEICGKSEREAARESVLGELGLGNGNFLVLGCGSVHRRKGTDLFVQLAREARRFPGWERMFFVWVGGDQTGPEFREWCEHDTNCSGLEGRLVFVGNQSCTSDFFAAADVLALTSREDPFPRVVLEAMAHDTPVVAFSEAGGAPEALSDGCGIVVPYLDIREMARALSRLAEAPRYAEEMRARIGERMARDYTWSAFIKKIVGIIEEDFRLRVEPSSACEQEAAGR